MNEMNKQFLADKEIICKRCEQPFTWTAGEQQFYLDKNLDPPRSCPNCRRPRKLPIRDMEGEQS